MATDETTSPSSTASSTPVTVTVCATFQVVAVNVSETGPTLASAVFEAASGTVTTPVGCDARMIVKLAADPASVTVSGPPVTVIPAVSSSVVVTLTAGGVSPL